MVKKENDVGVYKIMEKALRKHNSQRDLVTSSATPSLPLNDSDFALHASPSQESHGAIQDCDAKVASTETADVRRENSRLQEVISELRRASPSVARLTDLAVSKEREAFEEKIRRALFLLRKKDAKIRELGDDLASRRRPVRERSVRGAGRGAGGEDPGGGDDDFEEEKASFIKRLEACVANQAEQIEALVEEVARLRSSSSSRPVKLEDASVDRDERSRSEREDSPRDERICLGDPSKRLQAQVAQLEAIISAQTTALAEKDAKLERAAGRYQREVEESQEREAKLRERIETVERLLVSARHTVLDREKRLREAGTALRASSGSPTPAESNAPDDRGRLRGEKPGAAAAVVASREGVRDEHLGGPAKVSEAAEERRLTRARINEEEIQEYLGAQEWWLQVVAARKKCEEGREGQDGKDAAKVDSVNGGGKEVQRLRRLLQEQALEVVALRQTVLRMKITARAKAREEEKRAGELETRVATVECLLRTEKAAGEARLAELEAHAMALRERGDVHSALSEAREELAAAKLAVIRAKGESELRARLLEDEKKRTISVLSRAEDLQSDLDKLAVEGTLRGIPGDVSALALIDQFAGRLLKQSRRMKGLEADVCDLRKRCARFARVTRGEPPENHAPGPQTGSKGGDGQGEECVDWAEIEIHEAKAAMEAERRRALEDEIKSLRNDVLVERQRAEVARRDSVDDSRLRRLTINSSVNRDKDEWDAASLRRKLALASSEIEALLVHIADLRRKIRSGCWLLFSGDGSNFDEGGGCGGGETASREQAFISGYAPDARVAAVAALQEIETAGDRKSGAGFSGSDAGASAEITRLNSLLEERNTQVNVLSSTIEALRSTSSFLSSPRRRTGCGGGDGGGDESTASPQLRSFRARRDARESSPGVWFEVPPENDDRLGILHNVGAQRLTRYCVALTVRLTSATARAGAAERKADKLAVEMEQKERETRATKMVEADLGRRNRALVDRLRKTAAALEGLRTESAARLDDAGEGASKLRSALRDAELEADDARRRLESARVDATALATELHKCRERHRERISKLYEEQDARLKECADRFFADVSSQYPRDGNFVTKGAGGRGRAGAGAMIISAASPVVAAINKLVEQWRAHVKRRYVDPRLLQTSSHSGGDGSSCGDEAGGGRVDQGHGSPSERRELASKFLRETAVRLEAECSGAIRHARALEWELRGARRQAVDAGVALEEARVEYARLSARTAMAEEALVSASSVTPPASKFSESFSGLNSNAHPASESGRRGVDILEFYFGSGAGMFDRAGGHEEGGGSNGSSSAAEVTLLEKRFAMAVEELISSRAAKRAAEVGEAAAIAQAEAAQVEAMNARAAVDVMSAELERHKTVVEDRVTAEAADWRKEIRDELRRWWLEDLMNLHNGVSLNWGSVGGANETASVWSAPDDAATRSPTQACRVRNDEDDHRHGYLGGDALGVGVTGEEAMAQALVTGREEQAMIEERLIARERCLARSREEANRLRAVLERWHGEFVVPATEKRQRRSAEARQQERTKVAGDRDRLEGQLLAATAGLIGAREEATGLRSEVGALKALVARLREDENEARETAARRIKSATEIVRRRTDGDLRDAADRLIEERERFKSQLGAAHADILRLGAEAADLARRNHELELATAVDRPFRGREGGTQLGVGATDNGSQSGTGAEFLAEDSKRQAGKALEAAEAAVDSKRERSLRREAEQEREALRRMCNCLTLDLNGAVEARAVAEDTRQILVQDAANSKAEAQAAGLARENLEAALKEVGHLLESARQAGEAVEADGRRSLEEAALSARNRSNGEARRFVRVMVAAKVAEANLARRLQDAAVTEADLRHTIRRRDIRIEELKRELAAADRFARSSAAVTPWSTLANSRRSEHGVRDTVTRDSSGGAGVFAAGGSAASNDDEAKQAKKRTNEEVAQAAAIRRLELELQLVEAAARGEVGDATIRAAEKLALQLFPEAEGGVGPGRERCHLCGRPFPLKPRPRGGGGTRASGSSFLVPSAEVKRKATAEDVQETAAAETESDFEAEAEKNTAAGAASDVVNDDVDAGAAAAAGRMPPVADHVGAADHSCSTADAVNVGSGSRMYAGHHPMTPPDYDPRRPREDPKAGEGQIYSKISSVELTGGVRSLEEQLARLEAVAGWGSAATLYSADGRHGVDPRVQGLRAAEVVWEGALKELRAQVSDLRDRAETTDRVLKEVRARKDDLEEEALRLHAELVRQRRSFWHATATLKNRYERALVNEGAVTRRQLRAPKGCSRAWDDDGDANHRVEAVDAVELTDGADKGETDLSRVSATDQRGIAAGSGGPEQAQSLLRESLRRAEESLQNLERESREAKEFHAREAREAKVEIDRAIDAHRARVETLEKILRCSRRKIKAMARRKPTTRKFGRAREQAASAATKHGSGHSALTPTATALFSSDELLNMLTAAEDELFEAKGKEQRFAFELGAMSAEVEALRVGANAVSGAATNGVDSVGRWPDARSAGESGTFAAVVCSSRLASAEAEVERLRDEALIARQEATEAHREAFALRLAARRKTTIRADEIRSREKELRRQIAAQRREMERLRSAAGLTTTARAKKKTYTRQAVAGGAAESVEDLQAVLSKMKMQLSSSREEAERRGRAVVTLRAAKTSLAAEADQLRREGAELEVKLDRALKDGGVKGSVVKALRAKVCALEAAVEVMRKTSEDPEHGLKPANASELSCDDFSRTKSPSADTRDSVMRELRAERDRLRKNMRARQVSVSKQAAEIDARTAELERLEREAVALRVAVTRKDEAHRTTKKQLVTLQEELEQLKASSHRWKADAEAKWNKLRQASEEATRVAKTCRQGEDAAERELAALKSAFRSFLKTLWEDLRHRPSYADPAGIPPPWRAGGAEASPDRDRSVSSLFKGNSPRNILVTPRMTSEIRVDALDAEQERAIKVAGSAVGNAPGARKSNTFTELTDAEVSDIMQALSDVDSSASSSSPTGAAIDVPPASFTLVESTFTSSPGGSRPSASAPCQGTKGTVEDYDNAFTARVESTFGEQNTSSTLANMVRSLRAGAFSGGINGTKSRGVLLSPHLPSPTSRPSLNEATATPCRTTDGWVRGLSEDTDGLERWSHEARNLLRASGNGGPIGVGFLPGGTS